MRKLGVYIHIPFCLKKCNYCDFFSIADFGQIDKYIDRLVGEIEGFQGEDYLADTIFFGGGTPSVLSIKHLEKIMRAIDKKFEKDDELEAITNRLKVYKEQTAPLLDYYGTGGKLLVLDGGSASPEEVFEVLKQKLP